jgi:homoserine O-acetyltransferase
VLLQRELPLSLGGGSLAGPLRLNYFDSAWEDLDGPEAACAKPVVLIMPSMSHSALVVRGEAERAKDQQNAAAAGAAAASAAGGTDGQAAPAPPAPRGWWEIIVGRGPSFGIDLAHFRVLAASPLGTPYGSTSPLTPDPSSSTGRAYHASFPLITPLDQARLYAYLLDYLSIERVHAVVGSSMGGMQALQFARLYPERYERVAALCTTPRTSSSTQALRAVQRAAVRSDPDFCGGDYADAKCAEGKPNNAGPVNGLAIARMFGTICYRSREEFDLRFDSRPKCDAVNAFSQRQQQQQQQPSSSRSPSSFPPLFDVESYLRHAASTFTGRYDANCYLTLSQCMDLMDLGQSVFTQQQQQSTEKTATAPSSSSSSSSSSSPPPPHPPPPPPLPLYKRSSLRSHWNKPAPLFPPVRSSFCSPWPPTR